MGHIDAQIVPSDSTPMWQFTSFMATQALRPEITPRLFYDALAIYILSLDFVGVILRFYLMMKKLVIKSV